MVRRLIVCCLLSIVVRCLLFVVRCSSFVVVCYELFGVCRLSCVGACCYLIGVWRVVFVVCLGGGCL